MSQPSDICPDCGGAQAPGALNCPQCNRLVHAEELKELAATATQAEQAGDKTAALAAWRRGLDLLPPHSAQYAGIRERVLKLSREVDAGAPQRAGKGIAPKWIAGLGAAGLLLWKLKFVVVWVVTKAKFLALGLSKSGTVFSMVLSLGVYWAAFGWKFAAGLIVSIYIHEMGHVWALRKFGIAAEAPMFIPGLGAFIRAKQYPADPREDARVGLAGPLWGLAAAVAAWLIALATGWQSMAAIAKIGAWINLFNLLPVPPLDGGRGFRALTRMQRIAITAAMFAAWFLTAEGLLILLAIVGVVRCMQTAPESGDRRAFAEFLFLLAALSALAAIPVVV